SATLKPAIMTPANSHGARVQPKVSTTNAIAAGSTRLPILVTWLISPSANRGLADLERRHHAGQDQDEGRRPACLDRHASVPVPTFVSPRSTHSYERRNQGDTSNSMKLVRLWI